MVTMASVPFSFRLDKSLKKRSDTKCSAIEEAVKEADKGVFISSQAMNNWMDSWGSEKELPAAEPDIFPTKS